MNVHHECTKCANNNLFLQKKGFSIANAFKSFIAIGTTLAIIWFCLIQHQNSENEITQKVDNISQLSEFTGQQPTLIDYTHNNKLIIATVFILALSPLGGFIEANENRLVCLNCGNIQDFKNEQQKDQAQEPISAGN